MKCARKYLDGMVIVWICVLCFSNKFILNWEEKDRLVSACLCSVRAWRGLGVGVVIIMYHQLIMSVAVCFEMNSVRNMISDHQRDRNIRSNEKCNWYLSGGPSGQYAHVSSFHPCFHPSFSHRLSYLSVCMHAYSERLDFSLPSIHPSNAHSQSSPP